LVYRLLSGRTRQLRGPPLDQTGVVERGKGAGGHLVMRGRVCE